MFSRVVGAARLNRPTSVKGFAAVLQSGIMKRNCTSDASEFNFKTLKVTRPRDFVVQVELNRPDKRNAMNTDFWREMIECFTRLSSDVDCRAVVLSGAGKIFTAGLDFMDNKEVKFEELSSTDRDVARKTMQLRVVIAHLQESFNVIEKCPKPVIAAIHNACVGGGIDMTSACDIRYCSSDAWFSIKCPKPVIAAIHNVCIGAGVDMTSACDIRYCSSDAWFSIKEIDLGLAADLGTLQRFPKVVGNDSLVRELVYTARKMYADEAKEVGFVSRIFADRERLLEGALDLASTIAAKSPVAVQGSKVSLNYSRDHSVQEGLDHVLTWNQGMLQSEDVIKSVMASMNKETPVFSKL